MGLLLGVLFFDLGIDDFQMTFGLLLFAPVFLSFANIRSVLCPACACVCVALAATHDGGGVA